MAPSHLTLKASSPGDDLAETLGIDDLPRDPAAREREQAAALAWAQAQGRAGWPGFVTDPAALRPASPEQAEAERQDRAAISAEGAPAPTVPVDAGTLAAWEAELAGLLATAPAQRITDPERAASYYFAAEARRRLAQVRHDRAAAGLLMAFWRHAREGTATKDAAQTRSSSAGTRAGGTHEASTPTHNALQAQDTPYHARAR